MRTKQRTRFAAACVAAVVLGTLLPACAPPPEEPPPPGDITATGVAKWLGEKAAGVGAAQGFGFLMSTVGLSDLFPSGELKELQELKQQLNGISKQLDRIDAAISGLTNDIAQAELTRILGDVNDRTHRISDLYHDYFLALLDAGDEYRAALDSKDQQRIDDRFTNLRRVRDRFYRRYDALDFSSLSADISARLVPGDGTSLIAAKGRVLLTDAATGRYVADEDSATLRALYENYAEYEALASWMRMERWAPAVAPLSDDIAPSSLTNFQYARRLYFTQLRAEHAGLPPVIPAVVVIDSGPARMTTIGATMWTPVDEGVRYVPDHTDPGSAPALLDQLNSHPGEDFGDWRIPAMSDLTRLMGGFTTTAGATPDEFLTSLHPRSARWATISDDTPWPFAWSRDVVHTTLRCATGIPNPSTADIAVQRQNAVTTSSAPPSVAARPTLPPMTDALVAECRNRVDNAFAGPGARGGLLASRTVAASGVDHMGRGKEPYLQAKADLRFADLTGLYLAGLDLHDANLRGATLVDTSLGCFVDETCTTNLAGADLRDTTITRVDLDGADLSRAQLTGVRSSDITGTPKSLPKGWTLVNGHLVGPGAILTGADLHAADLRSVDLTGIVTGGVDCSDCLLPAGWVWTGLPSGYLIHRTADLGNARLAGVDLGGADLSGVDFTGADFTGANLAGTTLTGANLSGATLTGATLTGVTSGGIVTTRPAVLPTGWHLVNGHLVGPGARLGNADLDLAQLPGADLRGADLTGATLRGADLSGADLTGVPLTKSDLTNANLASATLTGADVSSAVLASDSPSKFAGVVSGGLIGTPAKLPASGLFKVVNGYLVGPNVDLTGANLSGAKLDFVDLSYARLTGANLNGARLLGTTLSNAWLMDASLTGAIVTLAKFDTLNDAKLAGVTSGGLAGVPDTLPSNRFRIVEGYLVGPNVNLTGASFTPGANLGISLSATNFTNANLAGLNLTGAFMNNADLTNAVLTGTNLTGVNLSAATLTGVISGGIVGTPALPAGWSIVNGSLVAPGAVAPA